jgi:hypothetical protein
MVPDVPVTSDPVGVTVTGSYLGIDLSATAVKSQRSTQSRAHGRGTARFEQQAPQDVDLTRLVRFDKVFAINVSPPSSSRGTSPCQAFRRIRRFTNGITAATAISVRLTTDAYLSTSRSTSTACWPSP